MSERVFRMSVTSRNPLRVAGAVLNSGGVNTGEQNLTLGGAQNATLWFPVMASGQTPVVFGNGLVSAYDNVLLWSGAGRLKDAFIIRGASGFPAAVAQSGANYAGTTFYDSATVASGNTAVGVGAKILGVVPAGSGPAIPTIFSFDVPFNSGLVANFGSGASPLTVTFTPEASPGLANPG